MSDAIFNQIEAWQKAGVIDDGVANALRSDIRDNGAVPPPVKSNKAEAAGKRTSEFSFFKVVASFAAICFVAAILLFVSANWDAIPRVVKASALTALMCAGFLTGAFLHGRVSKFSRRLEELAYLVGGAAFVGGVSLIGQMYHLPGRIGEAMIYFAIGLGIAGFLLRSIVLTVSALAAIAYWYLDQPDADDVLKLEFALVFAFAAGGYALGIFTRSRIVRSAAIISLLAALFPFGLELLEAFLDFYASIPVAFRLIFWSLVFAASLFSIWQVSRDPEAFVWWPSKRKPGASTFFAIMVVSLFALHVLFDNSSDMLAFPAALGIVASLVTLFCHGRTSRALRYLSYALFGLEVIVLYLVTLSSLLSTSGFFLAAGIFLTLMAVFVYRFEKRFAMEQQND
ncbi:MAG: DUF2157 domain-containing protein [Pseudomonadota bacterium]